MAENNSGEYVKKADGSYEKYNAVNYPDPANQPKRYNLNIEYKNADGSIAPDKNATVASYSEKALNSIINKTNVQLDANDYTYIKTSGDENPNQAVNNNFEAYVDETAYENVIHIQVSGSVWDSIDIQSFQ